MNKESYSKNEFDNYQYEVIHLTKGENVDYFVIKKKDNINYQP